MKHLYDETPYRVAFEERKRQIADELKNKKAAPKKESEQK